MKWITTDYKGNKQVWYSENTIKRMQASFIKILEICCEETKTWVTNPPIEKIANVAGKALQESEDNNEVDT